MRLEYYNLGRLKKELLTILGKYLKQESYYIFFFGSRVEGTGNERSDIDIGIEGKNEVPRNLMSQIKEDIDNLPTLYKIEIVDFKKVSPDFREVAFRWTEKIAI